jgi:hypothetical protein
MKMFNEYQILEKFILRVQKRCSIVLRQVYYYRTLVFVKQEVPRSRCQSERKKLHFFLYQNLLLSLHEEEIMVYSNNNGLVGLNYQKGNLRVQTIHYFHQVMYNISFEVNIFKYYSSSILFLILDIRTLFCVRMACNNRTQ